VHILILTDRDWTHPQAGGTGTNLLCQVRHWLDWGHRVSVIACGYSGAPRYERDGAVEIHRLGGRSTVFPRTILAQRRRLVPDPDVVLEVINGVTFLTPLWLRTPRVALVHHIHRDHYKEELGALGSLAAFLLETAPLRLLYQRTRFITVSRSSASDVVAHGASRDLVEVNYNGIEADKFGPGKPTSWPSLLYLGRLKRYKHIEELVRVVESIPGAVLDLAGEGDARPAIEREITDRSLEDRVRVHGFVSERRKVELLRSAWVHVTASTIEGWSLSTLEAAACGTPTVALATGGLRESVIHGETGLLALDYDELLAYTRRLVEDSGLRRQMGLAALARARRFSWRRTAEVTLHALAEEREALVGATLPEPHTALPELPELPTPVPDAPSASSGP
jgi:glycosyltransferase involved in cell wall biosynthesis